MPNNLDLTNLTGVAVAAISVYLLYKIVGNHIDHNTKVLGELRDAVNRLIDYLERQK